MAQGTDGDLASSNEAFDSHQESSQAVHDQAAVDEHDQALPTVDSTTSVSPVPAVEAPVTAVVPAAATTSRTHRFRKPALVGAAALVCAFTVGGGTVAALTKTVIISVDGRTQQVTTLAGSVDGALAAAGLRVDSHDTLAPAGAVGISDGSRIALNRGREFTVRIDGKQQTIWTTARTVDDALTEIGRRPRTSSCPPIVPAPSHWTGCRSPRLPCIPCRCRGRRGRSPGSRHRHAPSETCCSSRASSSAATIGYHRR